MRYMNIKTVVSVVVINAALVSGCSSPVKIVEAERAVPIGEYAEPAVTASSATLIVVRDSGMNGMLLDFVILVDGKRVGILRPGQKFEIRVSDGRRIIGVCIDRMSGKCSSVIKEVDVITVQGLRYPFRTMLVSGGVTIQPSTQLE